MLTAEQLCALEYTGPSAAMKGMAGSDARAYHHEHGEVIRWWKGLLASEGVTGPNGELRERNGRFYVEQEIPPEVRALVTNTRRETFDTQFGVVPKGATQISTLPDEILLARGDRVLLVEPHRAQADNCYLEAGETLLPHRWVSLIQSVLVDGEWLDANDYTTQIGLDGQSELILDVPAACSVSFKFQPLYIWHGLENRNAPKGSDGAGLPQIGLLTQESAT